MLSLYKLAGSVVTYGPEVVAAGREIRSPTLFQARQPAVRQICPNHRRLLDGDLIALASCGAMRTPGQDCFVYRVDLWVCLS